MKLLLTGMVLACLTSFLFSACQKTVTVTNTVTDTVTNQVTDTLNLKDTLIRTLVLQPGPDEGQNCIVNSSSIYAALNINSNPDINASTWTYNSLGGTDGIGRTYIKFIGLDGMPDSAIILSAKLSLFGISVGTAAPQGNSGYPGSPYSTDNQCWLKRVTADWNPDSLTWNNAPATTDANEVSVSASTAQWNYDATDIDVTSLINGMLDNQNYGFAMVLETEQDYRSLSFASCKVSDSTKWPKLVVTYKLH
ncbi:MAG TPA: DNRLRE domain-containing protein [Puia sp.]|nr:DNRLRE domain-containing protein [Puia sp.]